MIIRNNTTKLSEETIQITPDETYANEYGLMQLALESIREEKEIFDIVIGRDFLEAAVNANIENSIMESNIELINEAAVSNIWNRIVEILTKFMNAFESAINTVLEKVKTKTDYYAKFAKRYEKAALSSKAQTYKRIEYTSFEPNFMAYNEYTNFDDIKEAPSVDYVNRIINDRTAGSLIKSIMREKDNVDKIEFFSRQFNITESVKFDFVGVTKMINTLKDAKILLKKVNENKKIILNAINTRAKDAKKQLKNKTDNSELQISIANACAKLITISKGVISTSIRVYINALIKGFDMIVGSVKSLASKNAEKLNPQQAGLPVFESIVNEDEFRTGSEKEYDEPDSEEDTYEEALNNMTIDEIIAESKMLYEESEFALNLE